MTDEQATEPIEQVTEQAQEGSTQVDSQEIDYEVEFKKSQQMVEKLKSDNAGLDRRIGKLDTSYRDLLKKTETEAETKAREEAEKRETEEKRLDELTQREAKAIERENALNVKLKAVELGVELKALETLGIKTVEGVEAYKNHIDVLVQSTKEQNAKEIETALSGSRDILHGKSEGSEPVWMGKAFK